ADRSNEAQRNLDKIIIAGKSGAGIEVVPDAGQGMADENNPDAEAEPPVDENGNNVQEVGTTESKTTSNLRNFAERRYVIRNIFTKPKRFVIPDPFDDFLHKRFAKMNVFTKTSGKRISKLKLVQKPFRHYPFDIKPGQSQEVYVHISLLKGKRILKPLKIPFEIYLDAVSMRKAVIKRLGGRVSDYDIPDYMTFAGFTIEVARSEGSTLYGTVYDIRRKPVRGAHVFIYSGDRRQSAVMKTNKYGTYCVKNINPDNYIVKVKSRDHEWPSKIVFAGDGRPVRVDFLSDTKLRKSADLKNILQKPGKK
ncbi:MAG: carboxypeptidase regulatory-like domain-containing protein, partial [Bacteroidales bacterium]|nr:carboxypeptidase regulatory-like domain-containing protein [Bacteroidales bacterium]